MFSIPTRGQVQSGFVSGVDHLLWHTGRVVRDYVGGALAPLVASTSWRRRRLLLLGYHGVSIEDEHLWDGTLYMSAETFQRRLHILRETDCNVLPLETALHQLKEGTLPERAVALLFDDGFRDFANKVSPMLAEFGYPATVFVSSYYAQFNRPIFDVMLSYLLWKGAPQILRLPGALKTPVQLTGNGSLEACNAIKKFAFDSGLSGWGKDKLLARLAEALSIDYEELCRKRILHMMNAEELRQVHAAGHDVQLHTHRHRVSRKRELFEREIRDNQRWIEQTIGEAKRTHLTYPGGVWQPVEREWMTELGLETGTTCRPALADVNCDKLRLPRFMDNAHVPERVFRAWLAGSMAFLPLGKDSQAEGQILEETLKVNRDEEALLPVRA